MTHEALCAVEEHLRSLGVMLGHLVEGGIDHLALDGALHIRDFLGALVDEQDEEHHVGIVLRDGPRDHFEQGRLARLGGRHDDAALSLADGGDDVYATGRVIARAGRDLQPQSLVGIDGDEVVEIGTLAHFREVDAVDGDDVDDSGGFALLQRPATGAHSVAAAQPELLDLCRGDVGVHVVALAVAHPEEAVAVGVDFEKALAELIGGTLVTPLFVAERLLTVTVAPLSELAHEAHLAGFVLVLRGLVIERFFLRGDGGLRLRLDVGSGDLRLLFGSAPSRSFGGCHLARSDLQDEVDEFALVFLGGR